MKKTQIKESIINKVFKFDKVIDEQWTQDELFKELHVKSLISKVLEGYHATIFAYGQTGSGKTFTMEGYDYVNNGSKTAATGDRNIKPVIKDNDNIGVSIRAIKEIFDQAKQLTANRTKNIKISCSFLQIYNEKIFDLLNLSNMQMKGNPDGMNGLRMRWNKNEQFIVENLFIFEWFSVDDALKLFNVGIKNRIVASHNMNNASSRSHWIFTVNVEMTSSDDMDNVVMSKLQLVDLAGSERAGLTGNTGIAYKESVDINKSLLTLRKVINGLSDRKNKNKQHIPYRESKLTCLLKQSLGGNSYWLMIACLPPSDKYLDENISTLTYATKASYIANEPNKNEDPRMKIIHELRKKVATLEKELQAANDHISFLTSITGAGNFKKNGLIQEMRNNIAEQEVRMNDNFPPSIQRSDGTIADDENSLNEPNKNKLLLNQQKSTPVDDTTRFDENFAPEDFKSEARDDTLDKDGFDNSSKRINVKKKSVKPKQDANECKKIYIKFK